MADVNVFDLNEINGGDEPKKLEPLAFADMSSWDDEPPPLREWAVPERIPLRQPTLFSGEGAAGKTLISLQLCAAHVLGRDWMRTIPTPGSAIYFGAEDDTTELRRRLAGILDHYGARFADLIAGGFHLLSHAGEDAVLASENRLGLVAPTLLFHRLLAAAVAIQPKLIVVDTAADVFAGEENDRAQVRQFVGLLRQFAIASNSAVLLCSHPSLTGINSGSGLSGSTGWHNSVRARMYLRPAVAKDGTEPDPDLKELQFLKNNYAPCADPVFLRWQNGTFQPEAAQGSLDKLAAEQKADDLFLKLLNRFTEQGRPVNDKTGPSYAPALFTADPEAKAARLGKNALADAMTRLFAAKRIRVETYGRPSRQCHRIVLATP